MSEQRTTRRVAFEGSLPARLMSADGTWQRECMVDDVSDGGAKLRVIHSIEGLPLREFFLVLSSTGLAYRRFRLVWVKGDQIGVSFHRRGKPKKSDSTA